MKPHPIARQPTFEEAMLFSCERRRLPPELPHCQSAADIDVMAIHEAAHACVASFLGIPVDHVRIAEEPGNVQGRMRPAVRSDQVSLRTFLLYALSAGAAEIKHNPCKRFDEVGRKDCFDLEDARFALALEYCVLPNSAFVAQELLILAGPRRAFGGSNLAMDFPDGRAARHLSAYEGH
jgi:hypothetical protein